MIRLQLEHPQPTIFAPLQALITEDLRPYWETYMLASHKSFLEACDNDSTFRQRQECLMKLAIKPSDAELESRREEETLNRLCTEILMSWFEEQLINQRHSIVQEAFQDIENGLNETLANFKEISESMIQMLDGDNAQLFAFKKFLERENGFEDVRFWTDIEIYNRMKKPRDKSTVSPIMLNARARAIFSRYADSPAIFRGLFI